MNQKTFNRAMSYIDDDIVECFLDEKRRHQSKAKSLVSARSFTKWGTIAAVCCLVLAASIALAFRFMNNPANPTFELPVAADNIVWLDNNAVTRDESESIIKWSGVNISEVLYEALKTSASNQYIATIVKYSDSGALDAYEYDGKTYAEHSAELDQLRSLAYKYEQLQKEGQFLQFGERLYTEGLSDGTKWTKAYYDERISYYGTELLKKFIVDGVFLSEQLESDMKSNENAIIEKEVTLSNVISAYDEYIAPTIMEDFGQYAVTFKNGNVYLFVTPSALRTMKVEHLDRYCLYLASRAGYENSLEPSPEPVIKDNLSGFIYDKIIFDSFDIQSVRPTNDASVIELLNETIEKWRYTYDCVEFTFYCEDTLTKDDFEGMHYVDIVQTLYPTRMIVRVKYADINMEALKELSRKAEITSIHISVPSGSLPESEPDIE